MPTEIPECPTLIPGYPVSLASVHHDYDPPTVGVERNYYDPTARPTRVLRAAYFLNRGAGVVTYNPVDEHVMIVHNQDLLVSPPEQVQQERSFHGRAARDAGVPHWKYFWFD